MGDKKRKVVDEPAEEPIAPEGKKLKKDKKEKKEKKAKAEKETVDVAPADVAPASEEVKQKKNKNYQAYKEALSQKRQEKKEKKKEKREKKDGNKRKRNETDAEDDNKTEGNSVFFIDTEGEKRKEKKERKDRKYNSKKQKKTAEEETAPQEEPVNEEETVNGNEAEDASQEKAARFICFVGNLPYSANKESLEKHFEKNPPAEVRVATKKETPTKCRGFAFIEFDHYDRMKTALKLFHHSTFDDGKYPPRRINVELTAGGGGANSEHRKAKIQVKNQKLNDERQRAAKQIQKDKKKHNKTAQSNGAPTGANAVGVDGANEDDQFAGVHPSRRGRLQ